MRIALISIRNGFDRAGVLLSALCAAHCLAGLIVVAVLGMGGGFFLAPSIHEVGLVVAVVIGSASLGLGMMRHGRLGPLVIGACGIVLMTAAIVIGHGLGEALFTIAGVALVALAHIRNLHKAH